MKKTTFSLGILLLIFAIFLPPQVGQGQTTSLLQLVSLQRVTGSPVQITFTDFGTRATNYLVEYAPAIAAPAEWSPLPEAVITSLGGGDFQAVIPDPGTSKGFFRVRALGAGSSLVTASFNVTALEVSEGGMISPVINFSGPYFGAVGYTITGTALDGELTSISGEVNVSGTSATIPLSIEDNKVISELSHLILTLQAGPGIQLGSGSQAIITVTENDAAWQGSFFTKNSVLGFVMTIQESNNVYTASLRSEKFGFFPTNDTPVSLVFTDDFFSAVAMDIPVSPEATLLNEPLNLTLVLSAFTPLTNQLVSLARIDGEASLVSEVQGKPHLKTTTIGTFILLRPPGAPSTGEVNLADVE